jgi:hypothetical protein
MGALVQFAGYQAVWFAAVIGAGAGLAWPGVVAAVIFVAVSLALAKHPGTDLRLLGAALACAVLLDGSLAATEWLMYATPRPGLFAVPAWILALWAAFALTFTRSLAFLQSRQVFAFGLGAVFGPLAYWGAARGFTAVRFADPTGRVFVALALGWGVATWVLARVARGSTRPQRTLAAEVAP